MSTTKYRLLDFSTGCEGHWQNALYIPCGQCNPSLQAGSAWMPDDCLSRWRAGPHRREAL